MAWRKGQETEYAMSILDIKADPPIEEIISIPNKECNGEIVKQFNEKDEDRV